jgi:hypothetical protein
MPSKNWDFLGRTDGPDLAVIVNPVAFEVAMILNGKTLPYERPEGASVIAFNGPYFARARGIIRPLGHFETFGEAGAEAPVYSSPAMRPRIRTPLFEFEAGPLLVREGLVRGKNGQMLALSSMDIGDFASDIGRATEHLCVGLTAAKKLVVAFFAKESLTECAYAMKDLGCRYAINCDGGSSAALQVPGHSRGGKVYFGIELFERPKK